MFNDSPSDTRTRVQAEVQAKSNPKHKKQFKHQEYQKKTSQEKGWTTDTKTQDELAQKGVWAGGIYWGTGKTQVQHIRAEQEITQAGKNRRTGSQGTWNERQR